MTIDVRRTFPVAMRDSEHVTICARAEEIGIGRDEYIVAAATELTAAPLTQAMRRRCEDEIATFLHAMARHSDNAGASQILAIADAISEGRYIGDNKERPSLHDLQRREAIDNLIHYLDRWLAEDEWLTANAFTASKARRQAQESITKAQSDVIEEYKRVRTQASAGSPALRYPASQVGDMLDDRLGRK